MSIPTQFRINMGLSASSCLLFAYIFDYFRCGPRILTFFLYLSDVEEGGKNLHKTRVSPLRDQGVNPTHCVDNKIDIRGNIFYQTRYRSQAKSWKSASVAISSGQQPKRRRSKDLSRGTRCDKGYQICSERMDTSI